MSRHGEAVREAERTDQLVNELMAMVPDERARARCRRDVLARLELAFDEAEQAKDALARIDESDRARDGASRPMSASVTPPAWAFNTADVWETFDHDRHVQTRLSGTLAVAIARLGVSTELADDLGLLMTSRWRRDRWRSRFQLGKAWMS